MALMSVRTPLRCYAVMCGVIDEPLICRGVYSTIELAQSEADKLMPNDPRILWANVFDTVAWVRESEIVGQYRDYREAL
jgi:hypothetical protein